MRQNTPANSVAVVLGMLLAFGLTTAFVIIAARAAPKGSFRERAARQAPGVATAAQTPALGVRAELVAGDVRVERTFPTLAFRLEPGETLDARLPAGPFTGIFHVTFDAGRVIQAAVGAHLQGGQLIVRHGDDVVLSSYAGADAVAAWPSAEVPPLRFGGAPAELVYEFTATGDGPHTLRALWKPVDSLVPFPLPSAGAALLDDPAARGVAVARRNNCAACHASEDPKLQSKLAVHPGPILGDAGARLRPAWLRRRLLEPDFDPPARMPSMGPEVGGAVERSTWAEDLTHFLVSMGGPLGPDAAAPSPALVATGRIAYHSVGCFACHGPLEPIDALPPGHGSGAGAGEPLRTYAPLGAQALRTTVAQLAGYLQDPLRRHPGGLMPAMDLNDVEAAAIASYLIARGSEEGAHGAPTDAPFVVDPGRVERGRVSFAASGCANCHALGPDRTAVVSTLRAPALEALERTDAGCLARTPPPHVPHFALAAEDRVALEAFLAGLPARRSHAVPLDELAMRVENLRCLACHDYETALGPEAAVAAYFAVDGEADLGDEGRLPPTLTDAGGRLTESWMADVLLGDTRARPYLATRMPSFGAANVDGVAGLLARAAGATKQLDAEPAFSIERATSGRTLVGVSALNCIQCHEIAGEASTGTPGPDLALMPGRVRYDWFSRWLHDPSRVRPGTRMPTFFVGGRSAVTDVFDGQAAAQIESMWSYLSQGESLALPDGLVDPAGLELVVGAKPVVFRTFMKDAGVRAIACGFPEQVHCAFDADRCAVTSVWTGRFLSAQGAWGARGGSETNPEETLWTAPAGAFLEIVDADGAALGGGTSHRFRGYELDAAGRPIFSFVLAAPNVTLDVREQPLPVISGDEPRLVRSFVIEGPPGTHVAVRTAAKSLRGARSTAAPEHRRLVTVGERGRVEFEVDVTWSEP